MWVLLFWNICYLIELIFPEKTTYSEVFFITLKNHNHTDKPNMYKMCKFLKTTVGFPLEN